MECGFDEGYAWPHRNVLDLDNWTAQDYAVLLDQAHHMEELMDRPISKTPALRGKMVVNLFFENSTRTRISFELAEKMLSADVVNWSVSGSSAAKGESLRDTAWTLEAMGADAVVIRHSSVGAAAYLSKKLKKALVLNAGDGAHAHPTQALLDAYTAHKHLGDLKGRKIVIIGDIQHSRVARSDISAFKTLGCEVVLSGPPSMMPTDLMSLGVHYEEDARRAVVGADMLYFLRVQLERHKGSFLSSNEEYHRHWGGDEALVALANKGALVMHPGPMNRGVEIASSIADSAQSVVLEQVKSGVAVRMALLYLCMGSGM